MDHNGGKSVEKALGQLLPLGQVKGAKRVQDRNDAGGQAMCPWLWTLEVCSLTEDRDITDYKDIFP